MTGLTGCGKRLAKLEPIQINEVFLHGRNEDIFLSAVPVIAFNKADGKLKGK